MADPEPDPEAGFAFDVKRIVARGPRLAYNAQAVVDEGQIVLAAEITNQPG